MAAGSILDDHRRQMDAGDLVSGGRHTLNLMPHRVKDHIARMAGFGVPLPAAAFWTGIAMDFAGCALLNNVAVTGGLLVLLHVIGPV